MGEPNEMQRRQVKALNYNDRHEPTTVLDQERKTLNVKEKNGIKISNEDMFNPQNN